MPSASSTRIASAATSGPIPSPGRTATWVIAVPPAAAKIGREARSYCYFRLAPCRSAIVPLVP